MCIDTIFKKLNLYKNSRSYDLEISMWNGCMNLETIIMLILYKSRILETFVIDKKKMLCFLNYSILGFELFVYRMQKIQYKFLIKYCLWQTYRTATYIPFSWSEKSLYDLFNDPVDSFKDERDLKYIKKNLKQFYTIQQ